MPIENNNNNFSDSYFNSLFNNNIIYITVFNY